MPKKPLILLDTNMLLLIADGINVFEQIEEKILAKPEYIVLKPVIEELEKIMNKGNPSLRRKARFALEIAKKFCKIVDIRTMPGEKVDDLLIRYAMQNNAAVATNDRELRKKLREKGIPEIYLREEGMIIEVEGLEI
ncbi:SSU processome protein Utp24 [Staphylothermus marinus F1]|uniref:SSU processome protein Utp24 n=1 Tax=Staphylothermus marinus (strain ATCC 43588 / DSM 3639 / JCM 9404 / F1) TaxID=399550 RepID=A3DMS3_STAMF|nr:PIN domain-containing protein [Staphylothermus marinus]ABN69933.1 SSU processome protein Utp24 [Staphylothermus marinus F1]